MDRLRRLSRRRLLQAAGLTAAGLAVPREVDAGLFLWKRMFAVPPRDTRAITPNDDFYIVNYAGFPTVPLESWTLFVGGMVKHPKRFNYFELTGRAALEQAVTLMCIDTLPGADTIGNAVWTGFPLGPLLQELEPDPAAFDLILTAADGYSESIRFERALQPDVILAYKMNGEVLPQAHGFPLRLVVPGLFGIKNVKWITSIEVVDYDYKGYWQQRGWTDVGLIPVMSRIDYPGHYQDVKLPEVAVRGIAFGGAHGIGAVELSTDAGESWNRCEIDQPMSPFSWVIWRYRWRPRADGPHTLAVRAHGRDGRIQPGAIARAFPAGATGFHTIVAIVS
jgi:DMSO/TMAO reductase YedYZ molybdopterin-dependent catalytic subunit